jgi:hypothetical protein
LAFLTASGWLKSMRNLYEEKELALEQEIFELPHGPEPDYSKFEEFLIYPCALPRLHQNDSRYVYIINLDKEVLTINGGIHWKLGNIPRKDDLWMRAVAESIYEDHPTISLDICPEEHIASPAMELPESDMFINYNFEVVTPRTGIGGAWRVFLARVLAGVFLQYKADVLQHGAE